MALFVIQLTSWSEKKIEIIDMYCLVIVISIVNWSMLIMVYRRYLLINEWKFYLQRSFDPYS